MGFILKTEIKKNDNPFRSEVLILNEEKNEQYYYGELLLKFIYTNYEKVFYDINKSFSKCVRLLEKSKFFYRPATSFDFSKEKRKIKNIIKYTNNIGPYHRKRMLPDESLNYNEATFFINTISSCISDEIQYADPYLLLLKCELLDLKADISSINTVSGLCNKISKILKIFTNLQDFYYEAINFCFNINHEVLNKYTLEQRIALYYSSSIGFNAMRDFSKYASSTERYIVKYNKNEKLTDNYYYSTEDGLDLFTTPATDVLSRKLQVTYDKKEKKLHYNMKKNYNVTVNETPELMDYENIHTNKVVELKNVLSLCNFEFNKLLEYKNFVTIKECQLCKKLYIPRNNNSVYCDNIFLNYDEPCSSPKVGKKIFEQIGNKLKLDTPQKIFEKVYKRLNGRRHSVDKAAAYDLYNFYSSYKDEICSTDDFVTVLNYFNNLAPNTYNKSEFQIFCESNNINFTII